MFPFFFFFYILIYLYQEFNIYVCYVSYDISRQYLRYGKLRLSKILLSLRMRGNFENISVIALSFIYESFNITLR